MATSRLTLGVVDEKVKNIEGDIKEVKADISDLRQDVKENAEKSSQEHKELNGKIQDITITIAKLVTRQNLSGTLLLLIGGAILGSIHWEKVFGG